MLNIAFNASAAGAMMQCSDPELDQVRYLELNMEYGSLHCGARAESRYKQINSWFRDDPWLDDILFRVKDLRKNGNDIDLIKKIVDKGEKIRIWYDHSPSSMCGFCYLIDELYWSMYARDATIAAVCMNDDPVLGLTSRSLGSLDLEQFPDLLQYERMLSVEDQRNIMHEWLETAKQQWPLRTVLNGKVVGVPIDFYDPLIRAFIPTEGEILPRRLLGDILALNAIPDFSLAEWRLSAILHGMKLKKHRIGPEMYDRRRAKIENCVFYRR